MATARALEAVSTAVAVLLEDAAAAAAPIGFDVATDFSVISATQIGSIQTGGGVLPYRVTVNSTYRHPQGRTDIDGNERLPRLPVDLHLLIIVGASEATTQLGLAGWIMRKLEDHPVLPNALLNQGGEVFALEETVEVGYDELPHEELLHLWEVLGHGPHEFVVLPYVASNIFLDSELDMRSYQEVQERLYRYGVIGVPA